VAEIKKTDIDILMPLVLESVEQGGNAKLKVSGFSMYPLVSSRRDSVLLEKAIDIKVGDVPLFKRDDGSFVLHRIVGKKNGAYFTMGDYEVEKEYPVYPEQIVAKAKGFYRKEKYIDCKSVKYRIYRFFWTHTLFLRPFLLNFFADAGKKKKRKNTKKNIES